jgi:hypothetical protein
MLSKVMPLDEAETSATRLYKAKTFLEANSIDGEIAVTDNGSTDDSRQIALRQGVRAVDTCERGYDSAGSAASKPAGIGSGAFPKSSPRERWRGHRSVRCAGIAGSSSSGAG